MLRLMRWAITVAFVQGAMLLLLAQLVPGFSITADPMVLLVALIFTGTQFVTWPLVYRLSVRIHPFLFPIVGIGLSGLMVYLISKLLIHFGVHTLRFDNVQTGVAITFGLSVSYTLFAGLFSLRDVDAYDWFVIDRLRRTFPEQPKDTSPGTIFIEIDGLAAPLLSQAIDEGWMPNLAQWQADGSHILNQWETDLSSQTSASQAGILLGSNHNIPAFRWYDKPKRQLMVSSSVTTARTLETELSNGNGLLRRGASRWNVFSGDAPDSLLTYSTIGLRTHGSRREYLTLWASPYLIMRTLALFVGDVFRERWQAWRQRHEGIQPRMKRSMKYALVRASTTTIMLELAQFMLLADMYRGIKSVYCTIFAYDEVAHHSGIDRIDAFKVLNRIDQSIGFWHENASMQRGPIQFVILSDHGQSQGPTFRQRNGKSLGELVKSLLSAESSVLIHDALVEDQAHIRLSLQQALETDESTRSLRLIQNALKCPTRRP
ncbi:MAG: phage holin family protein [Thermomicrobiales bacterium]|nr:phage holin family protein [Thermomicrobiales bacterium]